MCDTGDMTVIDEYLQGVSADQRAALEHLRALAHKHIPDVAEDISYAVPAFRWQGKVVFGFAALKQGISLYPFSGNIVGRLTKELAGYKTSSGAIQIPLKKLLPDEVVQEIITLRLEDLLEKEN
jgi:uncharacterized protein YdhG (YjbR/CyaY superfamily)